MRNPFALSARERARLAWRAEVARAARGWERVASPEQWVLCAERHAACFRRYARTFPAVPLDNPERMKAVGLLDRALAAPRPWTRGYQDAQPRRRSRAGRRAHKVALVRRWIADREAIERNVRSLESALRRGRHA